MKQPPETSRAGQNSIKGTTASQAGKPPALAFTLLVTGNSPPLKPSQSICLQSSDRRMKWNQPLVVSSLSCSFGDSWGPLGALQTVVIQQRNHATYKKPASWFLEHPCDHCVYNTLAFEAGTPGLGYCAVFQMRTSVEVGVWRTRVLSPALRLRVSSLPHGTCSGLAPFDLGPPL